MTGAEGFAARYNRVWHVIEAEGAGCDVLYPAAALRCLSGVRHDDANRESFQFLRLPDGSPAIPRPQLMRDLSLKPTLFGVYAGRPDLWRDHINQHVFFWVSEARRDRFPRAWARLRGRIERGAIPASVVFEIDTETLLANHGAAAFFSRINSGSTARGGGRTRRDEATLRPLQCWRGERSVELAIREPVFLGPITGQRNDSVTKHAAQARPFTRNGVTAGWLDSSPERLVSPPVSAEALPAGPAGLPTNGPR